MGTNQLGILEAFGLSPLRHRLREMLLAFRGDQYTPASRFDVTSLKILKPVLSVKTWLGMRSLDKRVPIYNFFNRTMTSPEDGHSVRVTQVRDWRGGTWTYDSHNGTDFAVPVGTMVVAAASGRVLRVSNEFNRGGLKVFIDHGRGLVTTSNHLGRALVKEGQRVRRGEAIALSGASGMDMLLVFPWNAPHVHFNVWLNGRPVDPFADRDVGEIAIWKGGDYPSPMAQDVSQDGDAFEDTQWDEEAVCAAIAACKVEQVRSEIESYPDLARRAMAVLFFQNYYPTRFSECINIYAYAYERIPLLDLPFRESDFIGISYPGYHS